MIVQIRHTFEEAIVRICFDNLIAVLTEVNLFLFSIEIGVKMNC
ncbi:Uncharacterised protein [Streptococcus pneumoniae]|nr:Uncharacterised protein [Streptococcus pneumoniae]